MACLSHTYVHINVHFKHHCFNNILLYFNSLTVAVPYTGRLTLLQYITIKS